MSRHIYGACRIEDCGACADIAERRATGDEEQDPYGWAADREADRYERTVLGL